MRISKASDFKKVSSLHFRSDILVPARCLFDWLVGVPPTPAGDSFDIKFFVPTDFVMVGFECFKGWAFYDLSVQ